MRNTASKNWINGIILGILIGLFIYLYFVIKYGRFKFKELSFLVVIFGLAGFIVGYFFDTEKERLESGNIINAIIWYSKIETKEQAVKRIQGASIGFIIISSVLFLNLILLITTASKYGDVPSWIVTATIVEGGLQILFAGFLWKYKSKSLALILLFYSSVRLLMTLIQVIPNLKLLQHMFIPVAGFLFGIEALRATKKFEKLTKK